jgi:hypothetical protein
MANSFQPLSCEMTLQLVSRFADANVALARRMRVARMERGTNLPAVRSSPLATLADVKTQWLLYLSYYITVDFTTAASFLSTFGEYFDSSKRLDIRHNWPRIDQTTFCTVVENSFGKTKRTTTLSRLRYLEDCGLLQSTPFGRGRPRHLSISQDGLNMVEMALRDIWNGLAPVVDPGASAIDSDSLAFKTKVALITRLAMANNFLSDHLRNILPNLNNVRNLTDLGG